jgi:hypothetical protein
MTLPSFGFSHFMIYYQDRSYREFLELWWLEVHA